MYMGVICILLSSVLVVIFIIYMAKMCYTSNKNNTTDENNKVDKTTVEIGDVFVYEPLRITTDPFENFSKVDVAARTYIIDDLKTNSEGVFWVKYHSLTSHRRKTYI